MVKGVQAGYVSGFFEYFRLVLDSKPFESFFYYESIDILNWSVVYQIVYR
jgi:hypothetical protein